MQEPQSRWTLTGLLSAWGAHPVTIREAFPAINSTRRAEADASQAHHQCFGRQQEINGIPAGREHG